MPVARTRRVRATVTQALTHSGGATTERAAGAVVGTEFLAIAAVAEVLVPVELGSVLDLAAGAVQVDLPLVRVDAHDRAGRQQYFLAEDPLARVDHQVGVTDLVGVLVHLADA